MSTLIIPCAGKSSRFPGMRPKWMLTHPDGDLMIEKAMSIANDNYFKRIVVVILQDHVDRFEADIWLGQVFKDNVEVCILDNETESQAETVCVAIEKMKINGGFCVKDSDSYLETKIKKGNFVVGRDVRRSPAVPNIAAKSFISKNEQGLVTDIIEKNVCSNYISVGLYGFESAKIFTKHYLKLNKSIVGELYLSHIISSIINDKGIFNYIETIDYIDWGTLNEWESDIGDIKCCFVDIDGVVFENKGRYGSNNWDTEDVPLMNNIKSLIEIHNSGGQIIFCTARPEKYREKTEKSLMKYGLNWHSIVMGCLHSKRYIINDYAPTNKYPSCNSINIARNSNNLDDFF